MYICQSVQFNNFWPYTKKIVSPFVELHGTSAQPNDQVHRGRREPQVETDMIATPAPVQPLVGSHRCMLCHSHPLSKPGFCSQQFQRSRFPSQVIPGRQRLIARVTGGKTYCLFRTDAACALRLTQLLGAALEHDSFPLLLQLFRLRVYSLQHTRLLAFKMLVTLQVLIIKIDSKL
jgi:hypothetical protein